MAKQYLKVNASIAANASVHKLYGIVYNGPTGNGIESL